MQWVVTYAAAACTYWLIASAVLAAAPSATAALGLSGGQAAALWLLYTASVTIMVYVGNCGIPGRKRTSKAHRS
ncbi:hypothetical protein JKP88DRAFT_240299 [Tribonema minus]|nr:hypothetical protein JKP88DRAFT_240365 [Tribonema minus]KAG5179376.1 hypothetical protein JKP88DRAFT_240299 [Tribonema minus]